MLRLPSVIPPSMNFAYNTDYQQYLNDLLYRGVDFCNCPSDSNNSNQTTCTHCANYSREKRINRNLLHILQLSEKFTGAKRIQTSIFAISVINQYHYYYRQFARFIKTADDQIRALLNIREAFDDFNYRDWLDNVVSSFYRNFAFIV
jgi:hypothetical protein